MKVRYGFFSDVGLFNSRAKHLCDRVCSNVKVYWHGTVYGEDALLFHVLPVLIDIHGRDAYDRKYVFDDIEVYVHKTWNNIEIDALVVFTKKISTVRKYKIVLELKETDFGKMMQQLLVRRNLGTWAYGVIGLEPNTVIRILMQDVSRLKVLIEYGIGIISMYGNIPVVILESTRKKITGPLDQIFQRLLPDQG